MAEKKLRSLINDVKADPAIEQLKNSNRALRPIITTPAKSENDSQKSHEVEANMSSSSSVDATLDQKVEIVEPERRAIRPVGEQAPHETASSEVKHYSEKPSAPMPQRGRPIVHTDPRYRSDMPIKISGYNKSRIQALQDSKLGSATIDQAITFLIDFYVEKGLSKDENTLVETMTNEYMETLKRQPRYSGYFQ